MYWKAGFAKQLSPAEYDRLSLDKIVAMIEKGHDLKTLTPDMIP
jgi:hypothetical protein